MKVLFCASEVAPFAKTGGLGDVAGSLPLALEKLGFRTMIVMPRYRGLPGEKKNLSENVSVHFVEHEAYFNRASLYGNCDEDYPDNLKRFSFFCEAALELAKLEGFKPDVVHAHDWQAALLPVYLKTKFAADPFFKESRSVMTLHNIAYQGIFPRVQFGDLGLPEGLVFDETFEYYGKINLLKGGIIFSDGITTVSPTYADEIQTKEYGFGLEGVVKKKNVHLRGILNGVDTRVWDPATDRTIRQTYSAENLEGKAVCKADLQASCGFETDHRVPLFCIISRLVQQKGLDLLTEIADSFLSRKVQFVLLGEGEAAYKTAFGNIQRRHPKNSKVYLEFDAQEARRIYAGADFFMMPSIFEPCGLSQLISLKYGTIPVVRHTGGLADTIKDIGADPQEGNGLVFQSRSPEKFLETLVLAENLFQDKDRFQNIRKRAMKSDFSWKKSAVKYAEFYKEIMKS